MRKKGLFSVILILVLATALALSGCAIFQKPPASADEKAAWIEGTKSSMQLAFLGEDILYTGFNIFCLEGSIDQKTCTLGGTLHAEYKENHATAMDAIGKYKRGEITQMEAQLLVDKAIVDSLAKVTAVLRASAEPVARAKGIKLRSGDLSVPSGKKK